MDPISASCFNLNSLSDEVSSQALAQQKLDQKFKQILGSTVSITNLEKRDFKNLTPQILAAVLVTSYHVAIGISLAHSAIIFPQMQKNPEFEITCCQASWIASIIALTTPAGNLLVGFLMDRYGRLKTLAMASLPGVAGWVTIALSTNVYMLITGRGLIGFATAIGSNPAIVYLTEIARKDMRGSLISLAPALTSLGMVLTFILGWFISWKQVAWLTNIVIIVPCILVFFIPESPAWLVSKNRISEAKESLMWINKYQPKLENRDVTLSELQLVLLQRDHEMKMIEVSRRSESGVMATIHEFMKPTGYKPMLVLIGLFSFQQFSGIFIFLFHSITFFQEVGSTMNPYLTSIFIGIIRFLMSMVNTYVLRTSHRRPLMIISCLGMSVCIFLSGLFTYWIKVGTSTLTWAPVVCLLLFVVTSMIGLIPIPYTMTAELFPLEIRGLAQSICNCIANFIMFASLQLYPVMFRYFDGMYGVLYFFALNTLVAVVFVYILMPETHEKKLSEIEDYFSENFVFIGKDREKKGEEVTEKKQHRQERCLLQKV